MAARSPCAWDNGPEFTAQPFVEGCAEHGVAPHYIQPRQARSKRVHRTFQPHLSHRGIERARLRHDRRTASTDRSVVAHLQPGTAPRQPRPGAAPHVSAEAHKRRSVSLGTVRLTGKLTHRSADGLRIWRVAHLHDTFRLYVDQEGCVRGDHEIQFLGVPVITLHYRMSLRTTPQSHDRALKNREIGREGSVDESETLSTTRSS
jgi:hypothetical protein